jgi:hypothetical protein
MGRTFSGHGVDLAGASKLQQHDKNSQWIIKVLMEFPQRSRWRQVFSEQHCQSSPSVVRQPRAVIREFD